MKYTKTLTKLKNNNYSNYNYSTYLWYMYHSKLFGSVIFRGKKLNAFNFLQNLKQSLKKVADPYHVFLISMVNITPKIILKPAFMGGTLKSIPIYVTEKKQFSIAIEWTVGFLKKKFKKVNVALLSELLILSFFNKGEAVLKKKSFYKTALENRYLLSYFK